MTNEELDNVSKTIIENDFGERFCYCCGETKPRYEYWCDWFQIGGRWCDLLKAKRGYVGERSWANEKDKQNKNSYSVVEIKDLTAPLPRSNIYAVATKSRIYTKDNIWQNGEANPTKFKRLLDKIDNKQIKGVIALIDCHD